MLMGIGGTPEGVISAAAVKCFGGAIQGRLWPRDRRGAAGARRRRHRPRPGARRRTTSVAGDNVFVAATGVTDGALLQGVRYTRGGAVTDSLVMRSRSGTFRKIEATHAFEKLRAIAGAVRLVA